MGIRLARNIPVLSGDFIMNMEGALAILLKEILVCVNLCQLIKVHFKLVMQLLYL